MTHTNLPVVDGILQYLLDGLRCEIRLVIVAARNLTNLVRVQLDRDARDSHVLVGVPIEYVADDLRLVLFNHQDARGCAVLILPYSIPVRCLSAVPLALTGLLVASGTGLLADGLVLHLCEYRRHHQQSTTQSQ